VSDALVIRDARLGDEDAILVLLFEFAQFERLTEKFRLTRERIARDFIGRERRVQCDVAEWDGAIAGVMIWYRSYATFAASPGIYLEDLFVRSEFRRRGIGNAFVERLARYAAEEGADRIDWCVLDWNRVAIEFYENLGARQVSDWQIYRLGAEALARLTKA
jgi:diamine N-acetyltransferase